MKILIDLTQISRQKTGVGVYAINLIKHILTSDHQNHYYLLIQDDEHDLDEMQAPNVNFVKVKSLFFRKLPLRFLLEQIYLPLLALKIKADLIHSLHYSFPLLVFGVRRVVTLHDMTFIKYPHYHVRFKRFYFGFFIKMVSILGVHILVDSASTLKDYLDYIGKANNLLKKVFYMGVSEKFRPDVSQAEIERIKKKYGVAGDFILYLGTIEPRKNLQKLLEAYHKLRTDHPNILLIIAGKKGWYYKNVFDLVMGLKLEKNVLFTGFIDEEDKPALINGARVFVYPSIYEGFGIPVLEALACGVPTITSNVSSMPEVAGDAAVLIDPNDTDSMRRHIERLLTDMPFRKILREKSIEQAKKFSWNFAARDTIEMYQSVCQWKISTGT